MAQICTVTAVFRHVVIACNSCGEKADLGPSPALHDLKQWADQHTVDHHTVAADLTSGRSLSELPAADSTE